jgi:RNA polymerase sigma-70 factor (ECF subfamily)
MTRTLSADEEPWMVLRAQAGNREALEWVAATAQGFLERRLSALIDEPADAQDVLQDVLFTLCRRIGSLDDARLFRPWAHRIAMRAAWKSIERLRRRQRLREDSIDPDTLPDPRASSPELDLTGMLQRVSPASRLVLTLHYLDGMTLEATAAELGVAPGTVKSRLAYGLRQLRGAGPHSLMAGGDATSAETDLTSRTRRREVRGGERE